ncbi:MAG: stage II sporulation protein M [Nocardia sp.]|nr:stage II sporulation protein M [Nocardia sp.]
MDVDAYSYAQLGHWRRLEQLTGQRRLTGAEVDEFVALYRRTSQQLARMQSHSPDPELINGLSATLARARARLLRTRTGIWPQIRYFFGHRFPAEVYRAWPWWVSVAGAALGLATGVAIWVSGSGRARRTFGLPSSAHELTAPGGRFESYYSEHPHDAFAAQVWTNNAWVAAIALFTGILILPSVYLLFMNALDLGISGGLMADAGRLDSFFGFLLPHGMLELTAVFVAGGAGVKLGWTLIDPGRSARGVAVARQGRATGAIALGLAAVLVISGLIEGFVTPSGWPAALRIGLGGLAELGFLLYVFGLGSQAAREQDALRDSAAEAGL